MQSLSQRREAVRPQSIVPPLNDAAGDLSWQAELRRAIRDPAELCRRLGLPESLAETTGGSGFPLRVPLPYVARMRTGDPNDPLLRQVWPAGIEDQPTNGFIADPVGEAAATMAPGLLQKYAGRALLVTTRACAIHCRYCFRREFPYEDNSAVSLGSDEAIKALASDPSIHEIILSGGDPLSLADDSLSNLIDRLEALPHLKRLRLHTRLPIVIPQRVTETLVNRLRSTRMTVVIVVHANHANELDRGVAEALGRLIDAGSLLLNQSVLLRGINDSVSALAALSERLIECRVTPYYLHELDRVTGAAHFEADAGRGVQIIEDLRRRLPGYAVPRLVREEPGEPNKTPIA